MIYCIGRNYAAHAKELGNEAPRGVPIVFFKPPATMVLSGESVRLPPFSKDVHYEVELAFRFGKQMEAAEICVANDLTARDMQRQAQDSKSPWGLAKGFKQSCGLGNWVDARNLDLQNLELKLMVNGVLKQHGYTKDMVFPVTALIRYLKETFPVLPGDVVLTGSPEGVGPLKRGDRVDAEIVGLSQAFWTYE